MSRITDLETLLDESPDDPFLIYALAQEYEKANVTMQAFLMYEHLVREHPNYIPTYYHYAKLLYGAGNRSEAQKLIEAGIEAGTREKDVHAVSEMKGLLNSWMFDADDD